MAKIFINGNLHAELPEGEDEAEVVNSKGTTTKVNYHALDTGFPIQQVLIWDETLAGKPTRPTEEGYRVMEIGRKSNSGSQQLKDGGTLTVEIETPLFVLAEVQNEGHSWKERRPNSRWERV